MDADEDLTGKRRLGWNIAVAWLGQVVVVVSGFVIPRLIDRQLDQAALGIWDFGWSTVTYFRFFGLGLGGGLNRYVAYYRAKKAHDELTRAVSSTAFLQLVVAAVTVLTAFLVGHASHLIFRGSSADLAFSARWLITLLGAGLAVRMLCWPARGVLTGHHRWATSSATTACGDILLLVLMMLSLYNGGGLIALGLSFLGTSIFTETLRTYFARRVYGDRFLVWSAVDRRMLKKMVLFGIKTNVGSLPVLLVVQTVSLILASVSGPAALAIYTRPLSLTRHAQAIVVKFADILTSTTAGLHGLAREAEIREFFITGTRSAFAITLPLLLIVAVYGDVMVRVWMGDGYVDPLLAPLLAAGMLLPYANAAGMRILIGLNAHGRIAILSITASSIMMIIGVAIAFAVGWSPRTAAVVCGVSLTAGPGIIVPLGACRRLKVGIIDYLKRVFALPIACNLVFAAIIAIPRLHTARPSVAESLLAILVGGAVLAALYWFRLLQRETKQYLLSRVPLRYRTADAPGE